MNGLSDTPQDLLLPIFTVTFVQSINDDDQGPSESDVAKWCGNQLFELYRKGSVEHGWVVFYASDHGVLEFGQVSGEVVCNRGKEFGGVAARWVSLFEKEARTEAALCLEVLTKSLRNGGFTGASRAIQPEDLILCIVLRGPVMELCQYVRTGFRVTSWRGISLARVVGRVTGRCAMQFVKS